MPSIRLTPCSMLDNAVQHSHQETGSIATQKYVEPLAEIFGDQLLFPPAFVGRGSMIRGGLLLRCCLEKVELDYVGRALPTGPRKTVPYDSGQRDERGYTAGMIDDKLYLLTLAQEFPGGPTYFCTTPHAMRLPAFPVGSVL